MENRVKSRNYYETLGLAPTATEREIKEAFKRKIGPFETHPLGAAAQVCIAYETLRDPIKRREHDRSLGLLSEKPPQAAIPPVQARWAPFIASPRFIPLVQPVVSPVPSPRATPTPEREAEAAVHPKVAAIAASLQELARPIAPEEAAPGTGPTRFSTDEGRRQRPPAGSVADHRKVSPGEPLRPDPGGLQSSSRTVSNPRTPQAGDVALENLVREIRERGLTEKERLNKSDHRSWDWKRPAVALGSLIAGAAAFGTLAGLSVKGDEAPAKAETVTSGTAVHSKHHEGVVPTSLSLASVEPEVGSTIRNNVHPHTRAHTLSRVQAATFPEQPVAQTLTPETDPAPDSTDQHLPDSAPEIATKLPLPGKIIARTIERIGYPCGGISSSAAVSDTPGVFTVACRSGQSYRATPVHGRYHFRPVGDR